MSGDRAGADVDDAAVAVVAAGQHLQHDGVVEVVVEQPLAEHPDQGSVARTIAGDPLGAIGGVRVGVQVAQVFAHVGVHPGAVAAQQGLAEPGEHHAAREVGHDGEPHLGGGDQAFEGEPGGLPQGQVGRGLAEPGPQQRP